MAEIIFNQWVSRITHELRQAPRGLRFNELERRLAMPSSRMLSQNLKRLVRDGLVIRDVIKLAPPGIVVYSLSPLGRELSESTAALMSFWKEHHRPPTSAAPDRAADTDAA